MGSARHIAALDGLRGFAALSVVVYHVGQWLDAKWLAANSDLAVDFFFCLSGYVLAHAYGDHLRAGMKWPEFMRFRIVRLWPMIVLGCLISAAYVALRSLLPGQPGDTAALIPATALGILNLPFFDAPRRIGGPQVFPLNGPQYSLFLEMVVNLAWVVAFRWLGLAACFGIAVLSLVSLSVTGLGGDETATFWLGFPRVGMSFFLGVAALNLERRYRPHLGLAPLFWPLSLLMLLAFLWPFHLPLSIRLGWIALISPLLVMAAAQVSFGPRTERLASLGGELSYPIYALHFPIFCWLNGGYQVLAGRPNVAVELPLVLLVVVLSSFLASRFVDVPLRRILSRRRDLAGGPEIRRKNRAVAAP